MLALTDGLGVDVSIEAVGYPQTLHTAAALVRPGGTIANIGVHGVPVELPMQEMWIKNVTLTMGLVDTTSIPTLLTMVASGRIPAREDGHPHLSSRRDRAGLRGVRQRLRQRGAQGRDHRSLTLVGDRTPRGGTDQGSFGDDDTVTILRALVLTITLVGTLFGTATAATAAPATVPAAAAKKMPCASTVRACVRLSTNQAWLLRDGKIVSGPVPVSHGRKGFATPPGTFRVTYKSQDHVSTIYDREMPYSVFFNGGIAFHQGSVRQKSHGCVHLTASAARTFFSELSPGDRVQVVA